METLNRRLLDFIAAAATAFHAVEQAAGRLQAEGYRPVALHEIGALGPGGRGYVTVNGSTLIALRLPQEQPTGFQLAAAHGDAPTFKLKAVPERTAARHYVQLNTERYGGMLMNPWFDRPLGVAGRVVVEENGALHSRLVYPDADVAIIPSVAPHLNSEANNGFKPRPHVDTLPLCALDGGAGALEELIARAAGVERTAVVDGDLYLVCRDRGTVVGTRGELLCAPRMDDLACAFACLEGFLTAQSSRAIAVYCLFDNEEVGSATRQGAGSTVLARVLQLAARACSCTAEQLYPGSFLLSADNAHALHPNHPELSDGDNAPVLGGGVVLKYNANQRYTTDGVSAALFRQLCRAAGVRVQSYANRADLPGGSTLGGIAATHVPVMAADIGLAQLAMHSCYETIGAADLEQLVRAVRTFYGSALMAADGCWQWQLPEA